MPAAGQVIRALDFPPEAGAVVVDDETGFVNTTFVAGTVTCATTFVAPTSGRVSVKWSARIDHNEATGGVGDRTMVSVEVREGAVVGVGTIVSAATGDVAVQISQATRLQASMFRTVPGLTPGASYNARTMHAVTGGSGDIFDRSISVTPLP